MFTGIIEGCGKITAIRAAGQGRRLSIETDFALERTQIGDSIAVSGACLTVVALEQTHFTADVSPETLSKTTFGAARIGERVNLERALRLGDRLDGHLVSGHIDGLGSLKGRRSAGNARVVTFQVPPPLARYLIAKGSVAVDGVSLTINACDRQGFEVSLIPHTAAKTTLEGKQIGDQVNIETDMIGKYVERFVNAPAARGERLAGPPGTIDWGSLLKS